MDRSSGSSAIRNRSRESKSSGGDALPDFKLFTVEEAERTLPLVRRIVRDLTVEYPAWREAVAQFEILTGGARADWGETRELIEAREKVSTHAERINRYLQELEAVGCVFKGFEAGLV